MLPYSPRKWKDKGNSEREDILIKSLPKSCIDMNPYSFSNERRKVLITLIKYLIFLNIQRSFDCQPQSLNFGMHLFCRQVKIQMRRKKAQCGKIHHW